MHSPLRRAAIGFCVSMMLPATSFAAGDGIRDRSLERAAFRKMQNAVERRIPVQPSQTPNIVFRSSRSASTARSLRYHRVDERPSRRELREEALRNRDAERADLPRPSRTREDARRDAEQEATKLREDRQRQRRQETIQREVEAVRAEVLRLVNAERVKEGLAPMTYNFALEKAAQAHAQDMSDREYFSHDTPEGVTFDERIHDAGYPGPCPYAGCRMRIAIGENLAKGFTTPESAVKGWMESPGHRANILHPLFSELGVGIVGTYWAQEFGDVEYLE